MTSTGTIPAHSIRSLAPSFVALWLPVLSFIGVGFALVRADSAAYAGIPFDLTDALDGLTPMFIGAVCVLAGLVSLGIAVGGSFHSGARSRVNVALASAIWATFVGVVLTGFMSIGTHQDPKYQASSTLADAVPWQAAAVVAAVAPLVVAVVVRQTRRHALT